MPPSVNLCMFATGRYIDFLPLALSSARAYFCIDFSPTFHIWTDRPFQWEWKLALKGHPACPDPHWAWHRLDHEPWPGITIHRYRTFLREAAWLLDSDFTFYCDVDMEFLRPVGEEILSNLVCVIHPGFRTRAAPDLAFEKRPESTAYVPLAMRKRYYAGGFQGGRTTRWLEACRVMDERIRRDEANGIVAIHHDESHWNWFLTNGPDPRTDCLCGAPLVLSEDYCAHEGAIYSNQATARIISLCKHNGQFHS